MKVDVTRMGLADVLSLTGFPSARFDGFHRVGERVFLEVMPY